MKGGITGKTVEQVDGVAGVGVFGDELFVGREVSIGEGVEGIRAATGGSERGAGFSFGLVGGVVGGERDGAVIVTRQKGRGAGGAGGDGGLMGDGAGGAETRQLETIGGLR